MKPRRLFSACAVALLSAHALSGAASAQQRAAHEEGIVEVVARMLPPLALVVLVDSADAVLLPIVQLAGHLGYTPERVGHGVLLPRLGGGTVRLDPEARVLVIDRDTIRLAPAELALHGGDVFVPLTRAAAMLGAEISLDMASLVVAIQRATPFPAQQRILAEQRRAVMTAGDRYDGTRYADTPYGAATGGAIVDWQVATSGLDPGRLTTFRTQTGLALLGGDLRTDALLEVGRASTERLRTRGLQYHRVFPGGTLLRQARVGEFGTSGLFARYVRGVEFGNRPHVRDPQYGEVLLRPDLPAGWDYEVFQGSQLLGYSEHGSDPVAVPLRGGATPVQVRMYGPAGEEVVTTVLYQLPLSMLRSGDLEYVIGGGRCAASPCERFAHADVRYGATSHMTVGGGVEYVADSAGAAMRPYALGAFTTGQRLTGELQLMPGALTAAALSFFPRDGTTGRLRGSISRPGFGPVSLVPDDASRWDVEMSWEERPGRYAAPRVLLHPAVSSLRVGAGAAGRVGSGLERWRVSAAGGFRAARAELRYEYGRLSAEPHLVSGSGVLFLPVRLGPRGYRPLVHGSAGVDRLGPRLGDLGVSVQPTASSQLSASAQWLRGSPDPALALTWTLRTGAMQSLLRASGGRAGRASTAAVISGSAALAYDRTGGALAASALAGTGFGGIHGVVFFDNDADGVLSAGDEPLPGAAVVIGGVPAIADGAARFRVWRLQPYMPVTVAVDSSRIADPSWTVAGPPIVVRPAPNTALRVDIPLTRTRELIGSLQAPAGTTTASLTLHITDLATGGVTATVTFSDGQFYVSRIRPGRYRLSVAASSLATIGADVHEGFLDFSVPAGGDDPIVELPPLRLVPVQPEPHLVQPPTAPVR